MTAAVLDRDFLLAEIRVAVIAEYRDALADAMLCRIAVFSADTAFQRLTAGLARDLGCDLAEAARLLHPTCQRVYRAASGAEVVHG